MVPIFRWDDALLENSKESTDQLLELISEFNKVTGHKTNAYQKINCTSIYTNNEYVETEIKNTIPRTIAKKKRNT